MVERQPNRPSERGFYGAVVRYLGNEYRMMRVKRGLFSRTEIIFPGKDIDEATIRSEQESEGLLGDQESLADFAKRRLVHYLKERND